MSYSITGFNVAATCSQKCRQGRDCTCIDGLDNREGLHRIDTDAMLASGVIEGPFRPTHPVTVTRWMRLRRWWAEFARKHLTDNALKGRKHD